VTTYTARWVFPVGGPPLPGGTVTVEGDRIDAVEPRGVRPADMDFGNAALIPGLVNAHTHLDLSAARGAVPLTPADQFTDWLKGVIAHRRQTTVPVADAVRAGIAESLKYGTTLLGDISADGGSFDLLAESPLRAVVFHEVIGLKRERSKPSYEKYSAWMTGTADTLRTRRAVSPHAPYTTKALLYAIVTLDLESCPAASILASHIAELPGEAEFLATKTGPIREFLDSFGAWANVTIGREYRLILWQLRDAPRSLVIHGNYLTAADHARDFTPGMTLVVCPRTHAAFGHPRHPWPDFAAAGVRVAVGTDSLASNPDLDVLAEIRLLHRTNPGVPGELLLRMATLNGAEALGFADECGTLEAGKSADFVAVPLPERVGDPHELLLGDDGGPRRVVFQGVEH
jgi:cytosine/adenosine deaminase-related metal-dependent hydrolase